VFYNKQDDKGIIARNKAMLVVMGFSQVEELDFEETFPPAAKLNVIHIFRAP
jgi:hypothetical protein